MANSFLFLPPASACLCFSQRMQKPSRESNRGGSRAKTDLFDKLCFFVPPLLLPLLSLSVQAEVHLQQRTSSSSSSGSSSVGATMRSEALLLYFTLLQIAGAGFPEDSEPISISHGNCKCIFISFLLFCFPRLVHCPFSPFKSISPCTLFSLLFVLHFANPLLHISLTCSMLLLSTLAFLCNPHQMNVF